MMEDDAGHVHYGLNNHVVQDGVATGRVALLKGDPFSGLEMTDTLKPG